MVIGFTERRRTVSEGLFPGFDKFQLQIDVATLRVSQREHRMLYRVLSSGTARVVSFEFRDNLDYDARFGIYYTSRYYRGTGSFAARKKFHHSITNSNYKRLCTRR